MNIVFFGSGEFAVRILEALVNTPHPVNLVVTQPDKKKGRHLHLGETPVKTFAHTKELHLFQPQDVNDPISVATIQEAEPDLFLVVSYGRILSSELLALPKLMPVNIHASLLPRYRGAAPIHHALVRGEKKTGVTYIKMNDQMDKGDILMQKSTPIAPDDHYPTLEKKLIELAVALLPDALKDLGSGKVRLKKQDPRKATYAPLVRKHDGLIRWHETSVEVYNRFRACVGWPGSFTFHDGKMLKILSLKPCQKKGSGKPGEVLKARGDLLEVACGRGSVCIHEVLPESHKPMSVQSFLAGHSVTQGTILRQ